MLKTFYKHNKEYMDRVCDRWADRYYRFNRYIHKSYINNYEIFRSIKKWYMQNLWYDYYERVRCIQLMKTAEFVNFVMISVTSLFCIIFLIVKVVQWRRGTVSKYQLNLIMWSLTWLMLKASFGMEYLGTATYYRYVDSWVGIVLNIGDVGALALCLSSLASFKKITFNSNKFYIPDILLTVFVIYPSIKVTRKERQSFMAGDPIMFVEVTFMYFSIIGILLFTIASLMARYPWTEQKNARYRLLTRVLESVLHAYVFKFIVWELVLSEYMYTHRWEVLWLVMYMSCTLIVYATLQINMYIRWASDDDDRGVYTFKKGNTYETTISEAAVKQWVLTHRIPEDPRNFDVSKIKKDKLRPIQEEVDISTDEVLVNEPWSYDPDEDYDLWRMSEKETDWAGVDDPRPLERGEQLNKFLPDPVMPDTRKSIIRLKEQHKKFRPDLYKEKPITESKTSESSEYDDFVYFSDLPAWSKKHESDYCVDEGRKVTKDNNKT